MRASSDKCAFGHTYFWLWREQGFAESVHVVEVDLDAGVCKTQLVEAGGAVFRTDIALSREGRNGDGVLQLRLGQIVTDTPIDITLRRNRKISESLGGPRWVVMHH